ncbi:hypothetical protein Bbelb_383080 [Branchiostoma belcheri]|nr:hypothetical protein Bbelb_383080 [Branchiostoma belcheri]
MGSAGGCHSFDVRPTVTLRININTGNIISPHGHGRVHVKTLATAGQTLLTNSSILLALTNPAHSSSLQFDNLHSTLPQPLHLGRPALHFARICDNLHTTLPHVTTCTRVWYIVHVATWSATLNFIATSTGAADTCSYLGPPVVFICTPVQGHTCFTCVGLDSGIPALQDSEKDPPPLLGEAGSSVAMVTTRGCPSHEPLAGRHPADDLAA